jgi:hypothetical protein
MHCWIAMTLFPRFDTHKVLSDELKIMYAIIRKTKIAPINEIVDHWLWMIKGLSTAITCTSLITRIANGVNALKNQDISYISTPRLLINEHYVLQGHHLKHNTEGQLVFFFQGYANEIPLPNPGLRLYTSPALTFELIPQEKARLGSLPGRTTRSRARNEGSSSQAPAQPSSAAPQAFPPRMFPTGDMPGFVPMHHPRWVSTPQVHTTGESSGARAWAAQSSDSDDMPPPVPP